MPESFKAKVSTEQIIAKLPSRFQSQNAENMTAVFQFRLTDKFSFYISIADAKCSIEMAEHDDPNIILTMNEQTFYALMTGEIDGMSAFLKGDLTAHGNVILATSLGKLFKKKAGDEQKIQSWVFIFTKPLLLKMIIWYPGLIYWANTSIMWQNLAGLMNAKYAARIDL